MITKFNLYLERKNDLIKSGEVVEISIEIMKLIKEHFLKCIRAKLINCDIDEFMYNDVKINLEDREYISFGESIDDDGEYKQHLFIGLKTIKDIITEIKNKIHKNKDNENLDEYYNEIEKMNFYEMLKDNEKLFLKHEITHMKDFQELYDIFYIGLRKMIKKDLSKKELVDIYMQDKNKYFKDYIDKYYDNDTEYNAMFISSLAQMTEELLEHPELLDDFGLFKMKFISYLNLETDFYNSSNLKKKMLNRIYDAYIKLKEIKNKQYEFRRRK